MKAGFVSDSLTTTAGGIFEIERCLALALRQHRVEVMAWGISDGHWESDGPLWGEIECRLLERLGPRRLGYAPGWVADLEASTCDLMHLQHLWMYASAAVHGWHKRTGKPYLVTPNGMLEPWTLRQSRLAKTLARIAYENRMLRDAACLQANTVKELGDFRRFGIRNPVCVISNGVALPPISPSRATRQRKTLLFLGRLHPKKGLADAIRAWSEFTRRDDWQFVIAGWDQNGHEGELQTLCRELGISFSTKNEGPETGNADLTFAGPAFGEQKDRLFRSADAFILPSHSEGLPMAVLEAWSYGLPVLMTDACNLPEGFAAGAAIPIRAEPLAIGEGLRSLFAMPDDERRSMGDSGRTLVESRFTWPKVAAQMKEVYEWILGGGTKPGMVE